MKQHRRTYKSTHNRGKNSGLSVRLENGIRLSIIWGEGAMCDSDSVEVLAFVTEGYDLPANSVRLEGLGDGECGWPMIPGYGGRTPKNGIPEASYLPVRDIPHLIEAALTIQLTPTAAKRAALPVELL